MSSHQTLRQTLMLEEMGIAPRWQARETNATAVIEEASQVSTPNAAESVAVPAADDRRAGIMRMDWNEVKASVSACTSCVLCQRRNNTVFGVGDENANWLFVGEGPGADEDAQGEPFVGQAGKLLDAMFVAMQLKRGADVYIANVVKCRPPGNRNPEAGEALACEPYLHRQIELIQPKLIVALGKVAAVNLLAPSITSAASVGSMRNKVHQYRGIPLIVTYHPAYLLRSLTDKARAWEDLCFAMDTMNSLKSSAVETI